MTAVLQRGPLILHIASLSLLLGGIWSFLEARWVFRIGVVLATVSVVAAAIDLLVGGLATWLTNLGVLWVFCLLSVGAGLRQVVMGEGVTLNRLMGAMCVYLLLGVLWGILYVAVHAMAPDSFRTSLPLSPRAVSEFLYFSFVTLTTLGYGDITPTAPPVQALVYLEAVTGQLYIAVLVASLVGRHVARGPG